MMSLQKPKHSLRILYLEDDANDVELVWKTVQKAVSISDFVPVRAKDEFLNAIDSKQFDVILSDYTLPGYDGLSALEVARHKAPYTPFIFVTGTIGEEQAVECLRRGATDYVFKGHLDRLLPVLWRAVQETEERVKREEAENALRESEERLREMAEKIRDVFWITSPDTSKLLYVSPAYEEIWGRSIASLLAEPTSWLNSVVKDDYLRVVAALERLAVGVEYKIEFRITRPDGSIRWIEDQGFPVFDQAGKVVRAVGSAADITKRKELETELWQAQKMESVGQLAGGIAHDFNNILTVVNGYVSTLLDKDYLDSETIQDLREVYVAGERAANLTRQLLVFSRKQVMQMQVLNLNDIVEDIAKMIQRLIGENISMEMTLSPAPLFVQADPIMLEQILVNLAVNGRDAMSKSGRLTIMTESVAVTPSESSLKAGTYICLTVRDTGCGISPDVLPRIFEPFFSTKEVGKGTGLGLATVFGIVEQHQGRVEVESQVGVGTAFKVFLPAVPYGATEAKTKLAEQNIGGGTETILLVEDEPSVRELAAAVLQKRGYRILQASSGLEALEIWKWHSNRISLLLTDMVMPDEITGQELAERLCRDKPSLRVLYSSGYSKTIAGQIFKPESGVSFLQKPYLPRALAKAVRDILDGGQ